MLMSVVLAVGMIVMLCTGALAEDPVSTKDSMVIVLDREPVSLDPVDVYVAVKSLVDSCVYDTLLDVDSDGNTIPGLAQSWEQVDELT